MLLSLRSLVEATTSTITGDLSTTAPVAAQALAGAQGVAGTLSATAPVAAQAIAAVRGVAGTLSATAPVAAQSVAGAVFVLGSISATAPVAAQAIAGARGEVGAISMTAPAAACALVVKHGQGGSIAMTAPVPRGVMVEIRMLGSVSAPAVSEYGPPMVGGLVIGYAPVAAQALAGEVYVAPHAAVMANVAPCAKTEIRASFVPVLMRKVLDRAARVRAYEAARLARLK